MSCLLIGTSYVTERNHKILNYLLFDSCLTYRSIIHRYAIDVLFLLLGLLVFLAACCCKRMLPKKSELLVVALHVRFLRETENNQTF